MPMKMDWPALHLSHNMSNALQAPGRDLRATSDGPIDGFRQARCLLDCWCLCIIAWNAQQACMPLRPQPMQHCLPGDQVAPAAEHP